jgi:hypothetical protein
MAAEHEREVTFRRLLALEVETDADARAIAAAARRLCEQLALHVTPIIGDTGVAAICARVLDLAERQFPSLASLPASDHQWDGPLNRVQAFVEQHEPAVATNAAVTVLTLAGELLATLIGETLTTGLLHEAWSDDFGDVPGGTTR